MFTKKFIKISFVIIVFFQIHSSGCNKKEIDTNNADLGIQNKISISDYIALSSINWKGLVVLGNNSRTNQFYKDGEPWQFGQTSFGARALQNVDAFPIVVFGDVSLKINDETKGLPPAQIVIDENSSRFDVVFGKTVNVNAFGIKGNIYVPQKFKLLSPIPDNKSYSGNPVKDKDGLELKWNADANNKGGVVIEIDYYASDQLTIKYKTLNVIDDSGYYKLLPGSLSGFSKDNFFEVKLYRGNYYISDNKEYVITCSSLIASDYQLIQ